MIQHQAFKILVQLDAWFDFRMGALLTLDKTIAKQVMNSGYRSRKTDTWEHLGVTADQDAYNALIKNPTFDVLKNSVLSGMVRFVSEMAVEIMTKHKTDPTQDKPEIVLNTYPFEMVDDVKAALIGACKFWLPDDVPLTLTYAAPNELTPGYIKRQYGMVVMYDYNTWLTIHQDTLAENKLHEVLIVYPAIYFTGVLPSDEELDSVAKELNLVNYDKHELAFASMEQVMGEFLYLMAVDVGHYCFLELK